MAVRPTGIQTPLRFTGLIRCAHGALRQQLSDSLVCDFKIPSASLRDAQFRACRRCESCPRRAACSRRRRLEALDAGQDGHGPRDLALRKETKDAKHREAAVVDLGDEALVLLLLRDPM